MSNKLFIAAAGSGKTTFLVREALRNKTGNILITTFTQENDDEIHRKIVKENGCIPANVTVQTWFSFLLQHGARPYQGRVFDKDIRGLLLVGGQSTQRIAEVDTGRYYFTPSQKIYSDKLPNFVVKCNTQSSGAVIDRLSRIYTDVYIDEVQDLSGYDLELLKLLFASRSNVLMVCDPRQGTYSTGNAPKHKQFQRSKIISFFDDDSLGVEIDSTTLNKNYRCMPTICDLSNKLYSDHPQTLSEAKEGTGHDGVFLINPCDIDGYLLKYQSTQLRDNVKDARTHSEYRVINFGKSKGLEFPRVLIYPTKPFIAWLKDSESNLKPISRARFYVAVTRAIHSVGIVYDYKKEGDIAWIAKYEAVK